ncbi:MAG: 2-C-methyl-D-erythritol 2,4-cyclodiphosphate synthase [Bacteroidales bacterium]|jgi:2-C-methyl-D-erythritol 2,4-cyclodiphosphate synthase|nr:2-C-methyl-D-erythritol 2,4-cyclodiphosphate synthase [Bacteroidales bacterium]MBR3527542.1 2-C-methyl-D-erythritol 2,4-cyclodiphosphate synthase [Bacteroidales bacterium]
MSSFRIGNGYDVHVLATGYRLVLGGVEIPNPKGCVAHSDGDVILHALCDAMLGAVALGDIGHHFPDTDPQYSNIDSSILLERVAALVAAEGYRLANADITLLLQKPKIAPYIQQMREKIASVLKVGKDCISVKATTTEKLGFVGREEGVASYATVLLEKQ